MKKVHMRSCIWLLVLSLMVPAGGFAQDTGSAPPVFRQEELDQMLAPIALYPDSLLIQVLIAATYPLEVVQASRWVSTNPKLKGDKLAIALDKKDWDPSVKSLVNFPSVLAMMNDKLDWTQDLGDAFLGQKDQVMATIQDLRAKAYAAGNLKSTNEQVVVVQEKAIVIEPANPQYIYVPAYNPTVVYGTWWYPAYPPYYYYPPGYAVPATSAVYFGVGVAWGVAWGYAYGSVNWASSQVYVNPAQSVSTYNTYYSNQTYVNVQNTVNTGQTPTGTNGASGTRSATVTTAAGNTATYTGSTVKNANGSVTNSGSVTGPAGNTASRSATTSVDPATGTVNREVTGPAGQTRTATATSDGSGNRSASLTTGAGNTGTYTGSTVKNADGSVTNAGSVTGPAGNTASRSATTSVDPATGTMDRSVTGPGGQTRTLTGTTGATGTTAATGTTGQRTMGQGTTGATEATAGQGTSQWQHDPSHRKGVAYKDPNVRQQFGQTASSGATARKDFRGFDQASQNLSSGQRTGAAGQDAIGNTRQSSGQRTGAAGQNAIGNTRQSSGQRTGTAGQDAIGNTRQSSGQRTGTAGQDAIGNTRQSSGQRTGAAGQNAIGNTRQSSGQRTGMDGAQLRGSTPPQNRSSGAIESLNRSGSEVIQQSIRGRSSRESIPAQKPSQLPQGGKVNQGTGMPNVGGGGNHPTFGGGRNR
jgi:hypothetical protein